MRDLQGWTQGESDAIGQTGEFLVWARLVSQSGGGLHVFLPLLDRGIDGLIHRLDDGAYLAVQVKTKSVVTHAEAPIAVYENHLCTPDHRVIGFVGEQEVFRRVATLGDCGLFRPFPDSEMTEVILRRLKTGSTLGIQVKTAQLDQPHDVRHVLINRATFVAAPSIVVIALAWIVPEQRFHETCLVLPAQDVPSLASINGPYYELHFRAEGSRASHRLDRYRIRLEDLATKLANRL